MFRSAVRLTSFLLVFGIAACARDGVQVRPDVDVTSRTTITGSVNQSPVEGTVTATFNTGRGGTSTCRFTVLPQTFNPGTFGTHT
jgi:hypothetical protein